MPARPPDPLILTARFDPLAAACFQRLRDQHFPAKLNIVPAHCTLFHHLPGERGDAIQGTLAVACASEPPMSFATAGLRFLGRGVAYEIAAAPLAKFRARLASAWADELTPQDRQGFRPHVTVQNKADPAAARTLRDRLAAEGPAFDGLVEGLDLWHYRGGPWEPAGRFTFGV